MKYMDYAAMGAAFSASQRASEAYEEIERLQSQIDAMRLSIWDDRDEREFQKWIEELIYQFGKVTGRIETKPGNAVEDFQEVGAYLRIIEEKKINTSVIAGLENKRVFEDVLGRAERLFGDLWNHPRVMEQRNLLTKQVAEREEQMKRQAAEETEQRLAREKNAKETVHRIKTNRHLMLAAGVILIIGFIVCVAAQNQAVGGPISFLLIAWFFIWVSVDKRWKNELKKMSGISSTKKGK